jgi:hypothetical protein
MRVNLFTEASAPYILGSKSIPLSLTIRPACGLPGDYVFPTNSAALVRLLDRDTELPSSVIRRFEDTLYHSSTARLLGVELSDRVLTEIGYFVD